MTTAANPSRPPLLISGGRVLVDGAFRLASVLIDGERIARLLPPDHEPIADAERIDVNGAAVAPGLIDTHVHGALGRNLMEATPDAIAAVGAHLASGGVTSFVAGTASVELDRMLDALGALSGLARSAPADGHPQLLGTHLEGPFLSPARAGVHRREHLLEPTPENIARVIEAADGSLRVATLAPELPGGLTAVRALVEAGVVVSAGHTDADFATTRAAIDAGVRRATHLFNAMPPVHHRAPGPIAALLADSRVFPELVADGLHLAPDLLTALFSSRELAARLLLVSDGTDVTGLADGPHRRWEGTEVTLVEGLARTADGGIAGSTRGLLDGVRTLVAADVPLEQALHAASSAPAASLGIGDRGRIAAGAVADLIVLDDELELVTTIIRGRPVAPAHH
ncbi:MAG: N-acetylglucosamine-6-phosphate deacetylase [Microbacteriaceae bacterium]